MTRISLAAALTVFVALSGACSTRPPVDVEAFVVRPPVAAVSAAPNDRPLYVAQPFVAAHLRGLCFVDADGRVVTLSRARFATPISEIVADAVVDGLRASTGRDAIFRPELPTDARDVLRLSVRRFEIDASGETYEAVATLEYAFRSADGGTRAGVVEGRANPASANPPDLVSALGDALARAVAALSARTALPEPAAEETPGDRRTSR
jgi:ABC-type uncharacterized transport system auxiliary subunit